ncbi:mammalian cell entry protein [Mycobacterium sp. TY814]|uniref:mammalian cell entry protein n=1 Tax=unclassified Mycobacterium TaxID=2642494 RepID=UPI003532024C
MTVLSDPELSVDIGDESTDDVEAVEHSSAESAADDTDSPPATRIRKRVPVHRRAMLFGLSAVIAMAALAGWWGFRLQQSHQLQAQRSQYLQVARQGALNLTTINWQHADADVRRILDGATGEFYNDFAKRSQPFIEVLQQAKATTVGSITEAGIESQTADGAQVLVVVAVQTSNAGEPDPAPRSWRMRISVQRAGDQIKVSNVGFVS